MINNIKKLDKYRYMELGTLVINGLTACFSYKALQMNLLIQTHVSTFFEVNAQIFMFLCNTLTYPAGIHLLKVNNRNIRTRRVICSMLTIKTQERYQASF